VREDSIDLPGGRFHFLRAGDGARLVTVLHGFPDHPLTLEPLIAAIAGAGYRVVAPWLRGYAPSTLEGPYHVERLAADVLELATALGHERFAMVGHDWGAVTTYTASAVAPERVLAAVTMAVPHPRAFVHNLARTTQLARSWYMLFFQLPGAPALVRALDYALIDRLWRRWSPALHVDEHDRAALRATLAASGDAPIQYYRAALSRVGRDGAATKSIVTPTLHLHGADDGCVAPSAGRGEERYFEGPFASEVIPEVGHFLHLEAPELVAARTIDWLRTYAPPS